MLHLCGCFGWFRQSNSLFARRVLLGVLWVGLLTATATRFTSLLMKLRWSLSLHVHSRLQA
jgi:hypothetical protein